MIQMQTVLDDYLVHYNQRRPHQVRGMNGRVPAKALVEGLTQSTSKGEPNADKRKKLKQAA